MCLGSCFCLCLVEWSCEGWAQEGCEVFDDGWFDFVDVGGFVGVDFLHGFGEFFECDMSEFEFWVFGLALSDGFLGLSIVELFCWFCVLL